MLPAFLSLIAVPLWAALALAQPPAPLPLPPAPGGGADRSTDQLSAGYAGEQRPVRAGLIWRL